ncbi:MAG: Ig-like domain-containing protein, partial [Candidatus Bipolaricaulis sp.]|nr:Ig-like domain-containing protein [Candidatus Bipolaricaulis sp.]
YTPALNYNGPDTFTYRVCDTTGLCDTATVTINVTPQPDPPVANDDTATTAEDTPVLIAVAGNDSDPDGNLNPATVLVTSLPSHGTVSVNPVTGAVTYTPAPNYNGPDTFTYQVCDTTSLCDLALVAVNVLPQDDPPQANNDTATTPEDTPVVINVAANDFDVDGNLAPTTVTIASPPSHGTVSVNPATGAVTYTPAPNYNGQDTFTYRVCDASGLCDTAQVVVDVGSENDPPVANDDTATTPEDTPVVIAVPGNDTDPDGNLDPTTVVITSPPSHGTVSVNPVTGAVTYTPASNYSGQDTFSYQVCDTTNLCDIAQVVVTITPQPDPPLANDDTRVTPEDTPVLISLLANDTDVEGNLDPTTVTITSSPSHGTVSVSPVTGAATYAPAPNFNGLDTFTYRVCDTTGLCDTAQVTINVTSQPDPPVANDDTATTPEDTPVVIPVLANDTDVDGDLSPVTTTITSPPVHGTVSVDPVTGAVTYAPAPNYNGPDTFSYRVCDATGLCDSAQVTLNVLPVADPPTAVTDTATTTEDSPIAMDVTANDLGVEAPIDPTTVTVVGEPSHGTVSVDPTTGVVTYTPDPNFYGRDTFGYQVCDENGACATASATVTVQPTNDPPAAEPQIVTTSEQTPISIALIGSDPDADVIYFSILTPPFYGEVTGFDPETGRLIYTPGPGFTGEDTLVFEVCDTRGVCGSATVTIVVRDVNNPPSADSFNTTVPEGAPTPIGLSGLDPDGDVITFRLLDPPAHGTISGFDPATGTLIYTSDPGYTGPDSFTFEVCDPFGLCDQGIVQLLVTVAGGGGVAGPCDRRIVISEIAWAGTSADPTHEWIELRNLEAEEVDLTGWTLRWRPKHPKTPADQIWKAIRLEGAIGPYSEDSRIQATEMAGIPTATRLQWSGDSTATGYYLVERRTDDVVRDVLADLVYDDRLPLGRVLDLTDDGDVMELVDRNGCTADTANADNPDRIGWVAGSAVTTWTMERSDANGSDLDENWHSNLGVFTWGRDAAQGRILGTPRGPNSPTLQTLAQTARRGTPLLLAGTAPGVDVAAKLLDGAAPEELYAVVVGTAGDAADVAPAIVPVQPAGSDRVRFVWAASALPHGSYLLLARLAERVVLAIHATL